MKTDIHLEDWAAEQAISLLAPLNDRWLHAHGVVETARCVGEMFGEEDRSYLIAAAYTHDIGYAPSLMNTGFHPLDGARYLRSLGYERLACLVAHHSEARFETAPGKIQKKRCDVSNEIQHQQRTFIGILSGAYILLRIYSSKFM